MEDNMEFLKAVADSKQLAEKPDNDVLLHLYSLYKQATEGDAPENVTYGMFDFVAKAKHEAWKKLTGVNKNDAENQYIELVASLKNK